MIFAFELEVKLVLKSNGANELRTVTQYAYSLQDAVMQTIYQVNAELGGCEVTVLRIGPPVDDIIKFRQLMQRSDNVLDMLQRKINQVPTGQKTKQ